MRFFIVLAAVAAILFVFAGCSGENNGKNNPAGDLRIAFVDPAYPAVGQPIQDEVGNWHSSPKFLTFTLHRVAGKGAIPQCDWEIRKGVPVENGGERMDVVATIENGQEPEFDFGAGVYYIRTSYAGTDRFIADTWLIVE